MFLVNNTQLGLRLPFPFDNLFLFFMVYFQSAIFLFILFVLCTLVPLFRSYFVSARWFCCRCRCYFTFLSVVILLLHLFPLIISLGVPLEQLFSEP